MANPGALIYRECSPKGLLENCDLFLADTDSGTYLLVDGSPGTGSCEIIAPRSHLFRLICRAWPDLVDVDTSPAESLRCLGETLRQANREHSGQRMWCSAVLCRFDDGPNAFAVAEVGDTKVLRLQESGAVPVFGDVFPVEGRPIPGALGTETAAIHSKSLSLGEGDRLVLLTDGAYHILCEAGAFHPDGTTDAGVDLVQCFDSRVHEAKDDATLIII